MTSLKHLFDLCKKAVMAWIDDFAPSMGAAISYYTMFSLEPLLVIVIAIAGALFGRDAVQGQIVGQLQGLIGQEGATAVQGLIKSASEPSKGLIAGLISAVVLIIGATSVFAELQSALDRIWHVPESAKPSGVWAVLRSRVLSFGLILGLAFLLMVSLTVSAGVAAFGSWAGGLLPGWEILLQIVNLVISVGISTVLFAMIFKLMPTAKIGWHDVWIGAAVTAVLFEVGKILIGLYIGKSGVTSSFAAAGSLVVLLAWVYYAAQIFLLGAEFTKVYASEHGSQASAKSAQDAAVPTASGMGQGGTAGGTADPNAPLAAATATATATAPVAGLAGVAQARQAREAVTRHVQPETERMARQVALLATLALARSALLRWQKRQRKSAKQQGVRVP
ncbi:MAG: ribonuclease [Variovorax sp.]|nr:ribonuclease [Variovorax sp.]